MALLLDSNSVPTTQPTMVFNSAQMLLELKGGSNNSRGGAAASSDAAVVGASVAKIVMVGDRPWFQAKPIVVHMGYYSSNVTKTLNKIPEKHRRSLQELMDLGDYSQESPSELGHNDKIALYLSEPGLMELFCKSELPCARPFQDFVFEEVLPAIRRTGGYGIKRSSDDLVDESPAKRLRTELVALVTEQNTATNTKLALIEEQQALLLKKAEAAPDALLALAHRCLPAWLDQWVSHGDSGPAVEVATGIVRAVCLELQPVFLATIVTNMSFFMRQKLVDVKDGILEKVMTPSAAFVDAIRKATKKPAVKTTSDLTRFPEDQRVDSEEDRLTVSLSVVLGKVLAEVERASMLPGARDLAPLTYGAWKKCRCLIGSRCLALRKAAAGVTKPLAWTNSADGGRSAGGGQHYVYLTETDITGDVHEFVRTVLRQPYKMTVRRGGGGSGGYGVGGGPTTVRAHIRELINNTSPLVWPMASSTLDSFPIDETEEVVVAAAAESSM